MFIGPLSGLSSGGSHGVACGGSRGIWGWPGLRVEWRTGTGRWAVIHSVGYGYFPHIS